MTTVTPSKPKIHIEFSFQGEVPSKKNQWKHAQNGHVYLPAGLQKQIDDISWQLKPIVGRNKTIIQSVKIDLTMYLSQESSRIDLDNRVTTFLDILQRLAIIKNDSLVREIHAVALPARESFVKVIINDFNETV